MGIVEMVLDRAEKKGRKLGMEKGMEKGMNRKATEMVTNLLLTNRFSISEISNFANVTEAFVLEVEKRLK